jgi:WhiB family transcriptional regulator, redox-sensing transcriptional regulator
MTEVIISLPGASAGRSADGPDEGDWTSRSLCRQVDPELFFPEKGGSTREAKRICRDCPVRAECLGFALENNERFGIWGGLSERERRKLGRGGGSLQLAS